MLGYWGAATRPCSGSIDHALGFVDSRQESLQLWLELGQGEGSDQLNLSTLHSAKGREFKLVVLFGMDQGRIPWNNQSESQLREWRRLFYVGFTRPETELHIVYTDGRPSQFVLQVQHRIEIGE